MQRAFLVVLLVMAPCFYARAQDAAPLTVRVATFNIEDVRQEDVSRADNPRLKAIAEVIQRIGPNIIFLNEIAYDMPGGGRRFIQKATGYDATICSGVIVFERGEPTGAMPGRLIRGRTAAPS